MFRRQLVIAILFLGLSQNDALAQFMHRTPVRVVPVPSFNRTAPVGPQAIPMHPVPMHVVPNHHVQHFGPFGPPQPITPHFVPQQVVPNVVSRPFIAPPPGYFPGPAPIMNQPAGRRTLIGGLVPGPMVPARQIGLFHHQGVHQHQGVVHSTYAPAPAYANAAEQTQRKSDTTKPSQAQQSLRPNHFDSKSHSQAKFGDVESPPRPPKQLEYLDNPTKNPTAFESVSTSDESSASEGDVWSMEDWNLDQDDQVASIPPADVADDVSIPQDLTNTNELLDTTEQQLTTTTKTEEPADWAKEDWAQEDWADEDWANDETSATDDWANEPKIENDLATIIDEPITPDNNENSAQTVASSEEPVTSSATNDVATNDVEQLNASTITNPSQDLGQDESWAKEDWAKEDWEEEDWSQEDWAKEGLANEDSDAGELAQELGLETNDAAEITEPPASEEDLWASTEYDSEGASDDWTNESWVNEDWAKQELEKAKLAQENVDTSNQQASFEVPEETDAADGDDWSTDEEEWSEEDFDSIIAEATQEPDLIQPETEKTQIAQPAEQASADEIVVAETTKLTEDNLTDDATQVETADKKTAKAGWFDWRWLLALAPLLGIGAARLLRKRRQAQAAAFLRPSSVALPSPTPQAAASTTDERTVQIKTPPVAQEAKTRPTPEPADDLTRLRGVSAPISSLLSALGIQTYQKLAEANANDLRAVIAKGGLEGKVVDPAVWVYQAGFAVRKDWDGLAEWQNGNEQLFRTAIKVDQQQAKDQTSDLTKINGIDAPLAKHLASKGLINFQQLASTDPRDLRVLLSDAGPQYTHADTRSWPGLAALAARGDWERFQQLDSALEQGLLDTTNSIFESLAASAKTANDSSDTKTSPVG